MGSERDDLKVRERGVGGWMGWLLEQLRSTRCEPARLALIERITLAPRQSLSLIEAEGRRLLVATSPEGAPAFYALDGSPLSATSSIRARSSRCERTAGRASW
jgi:hypothetical protein